MIKKKMLTNKNKYIKLKVFKQEEQKNGKTINFKNKQWK